MFCTKCGKELKEGDRFCYSCGNPVGTAGAPVERSAETSVKQSAEIPVERSMETPVKQSVETPAKQYAGMTGEKTEVKPSPVKIIPSLGRFGEKKVENTPVRAQGDTGSTQGTSTPVNPVYGTGAAGNAGNVQRTPVSPAYGTATVGNTGITGSADNAGGMQKPGYVGTDSDEEVRYDYKSLPTAEPEGIHKIYIIDFMIRMMEKSNIPLFIYLLINVLIIGVFAMAFFALPPVWGMIAGLLLYIASVSIALSPIGEWMLRRQTGCRKIVEKDIIDRLEPIFSEVYYKAKLKNPAISSDVRLFINDDEAPNAFATGRKTVCVTKGLLNMTDAEIRATLGHEFGHLSHRDTDRILVVSVGNTVITGVLIIFQIGIMISDFFMQIAAAVTGDDEGVMMSILSSIARVISLFVIRGFMKVWSMLGVALCMKTSRGNEYLADQFSYELGYGKDLCAMLTSLGFGPKPSGLFANLASSHPASEDRIARLQALEGMQKIAGE